MKGAPTKISVKKGQCLAILGTASDVGKSITVTALCRIFYEMGLKVSPFKAQNMSNNSFVSLSQGEIARAQAVQAEAARIEPSTDMNPVLLKPASDSMAQVVLHGKVVGNRMAGHYFSNTESFRREAKDSLNRLRSLSDLVIIEGAGSCAEINLRPVDFTNFEMAHHGEAPVILVADIDRGGVFAQIIGTLEILEQIDRERVKGIIINRFRGDPRLFDNGIRYIEEKTGLPVLGLIPYYSEIQIDSEDGLPMGVSIDSKSSLSSRLVNIAVILLPHISNFTDFLPFNAPDFTQVHFLRQLRSLAGYDLVFIPGSKNVRSDLNWLHQSGWSDAIHNYRKAGGRIGGICGGYQMLGERISDINGIEGTPGQTEGLKILPVETELMPIKQLHRTEAIWRLTEKVVSGYEIHHGITTKTQDIPSLLRIITRNGIEIEDQEDGAVSADGKVWGCYLHGIFDDVSFRNDLLKSVSNRSIPIAFDLSESPYDYRQRQYDLLAEHFRQHLDLEKIHALICEATEKG